MSVRLKEAQKLGFRSAFMPAAGEILSNGLALNCTRLAQLKIWLLFSHKGNYEEKSKSLHRRS